MVSGIDLVSAASNNLMEGTSYISFKNVYDVKYDGKTVTSYQKVYIKNPGKSSYELFVNTKNSLTKVGGSKLKVNYNYYKTKYSSAS